MSPLRKPPPNTEYPPALDCKWCGKTLPKHCKQKGCSWYPCRGCSVVTYLTRPYKNDAGRWAWGKQYRKVAKSWFV